MGDVADILGVSTSKKASSKVKTTPKKTKKPQGMSREVFSLLLSQKQSSNQPVSNAMHAGATAASSIAPIIPTVSKPSKQKKANKWVYSSFRNSARESISDSSFELKHWVKASNATTTADYPFARFAKSIDILEYTADEYNSHVQPHDSKGNWNIARTDKLFELCRQFELRWFIVTDRYASFAEEESTSPPVKRSMEELKDRYYKVIEWITTGRNKAKMIAEAKDPGAPIKQTAPYHFPLQHEVQRKLQLEQLFVTKEDQAEWTRLQSELRHVEEQLHQAMTRTESQQRKEIARKFTTRPKSLSAGVYLRSQALSFPSGPAALSSRFVAKIQTILKELNVPETPLPTAHVSEAYDTLRQDIVRLLSLQKSTLKKEGEVHDLKEKLKLKLDPSYTIVPRPAKAKATALTAGLVILGGGGSNVVAGAASPAATTTNTADATGNAEANASSSLKKATTTTTRPGPKRKHNAVVKSEPVVAKAESGVDSTVPTEGTGSPAPKKIKK